MHYEKTVYNDIDDDKIAWFIASGSNGVGVTANFVSGEATVTVKRRFKDKTLDLLFDDGSSVSYTGSFDIIVDFQEDEVFGVGVSGADSAFEMDLLLVGAFVKRRK